MLCSCDRTKGNMHLGGFVTWGKKNETGVSPRLQATCDWSLSLAPSGTSLAPAHPRTYSILTRRYLHLYYNIRGPPKDVVREAVRKYAALFCKV